MDARVCRALFLLDNDLDLVSAEQARGDTTTRTPIARHAFAPVVEHNCAADAANYHHVDVCATSLITPRPSIGKKKAKEIAYGRCSRHNSKFDTPSSVESRRKAVELKNVQKYKHNLVLTRIAEVAEAKHKFAQEKLLSQIYLQNPNSARAKAFFARMEKRYDSEEEEEVTKVPPHTTAGGRRCASARDYDSDDDEVVAVAKPLSRCAPLSKNQHTKGPPHTTAGGRGRASARNYNSDDDEVAVVAEPFSRLTPLPSNDHRMLLGPPQHTSTTGVRRRAMRNYDSDDDDEIDVVPESVARRARPAAIDARHARPLPNPPNDERHDDDDNEMDSLQPLPNTQNLMAMVRAMEQQTGDYPSKEEAATLEEQYDDSMDPRRAIISANH